MVTKNSRTVNGTQSLQKEKEDKISRPLTGRGDSKTDKYSRSMSIRFVVNGKSRWSKSELWL